MTHRWTCFVSLGGNVPRERDGIAFLLGKLCSRGRGSSRGCLEQLIWSKRPFSIHIQAPRSKALPNEYSWQHCYRKDLGFWYDCCLFRGFFKEFLSTEEVAWCWTGKQLWILNFETCEIKGSWPVSANILYHRVRKVAEVNKDICRGGWFSYRGSYSKSSLPEKGEVDYLRIMNRENSKRNLAFL